MQHEQRWLLQILLPDIGEAGHGDAIDDTMIRRPADAHDVRLDELVLLIESRHCLGASHGTDGHLRCHDARMRVCATNLRKRDREREYKEKERKHISGTTHDANVGQREGAVSEVRRSQGSRASALH